MNQLDATMIYWSVKSARHVSGNILPIIRSVGLRFLQHMVSFCCGGQGRRWAAAWHYVFICITLPNWWCTVKQNSNIWIIYKNVCYIPTYAEI